MSTAFETIAKTNNAKDRNTKTLSTCGQQCIMNCPEHIHRISCLCLVPKKKKNEICNRRQITPQGIYLHYGFNLFTFLSRIKLRLLRFLSIQKQKICICNHFRPNGIDGAVASTVTSALESRWAPTNTQETKEKLLCTRLERRARKTPCVCFCQRVPCADHIVWKVFFFTLQPTKTFKYSFSHHCVMRPARVFSLCSIYQ